MNVDELIYKLKITEEENKKLQDELIQTKEHLKKYTAPASRKVYYEMNKEESLLKPREAVSTTIDFTLLNFLFSYFCANLNIQWCKINLFYRYINGSRK